MQIPTLLTTAAIFAASAAAQSAVTPTATGGPAPTSTSSGDLYSLVNQLPQCAITCLNSSASTIGCNASDLTCLCSKSDQLVTSIGTCILFNSGCSSEEQTQIQNVAGSLCSDVNSANSAELASASNYINSAIATGTTASASVPTSTSTSSTENAAGRADASLAGMGAIGAAAALAVLAF